jgi:hypothetical protein
MAPHARRWRLAAALIAAALGTALVAGGCSSSKNESGTAGSGAPAPAGDFAAEPDRKVAEQAGGGDAAQGAPPAKPGEAVNAPTRVDTADRQIIRTASLAVRVENVRDAAQSAAGIAQAAKGHISGENRSLDEDSSIADLTIRVPGDTFEATLTKLSELGREENRTIKTDDVTEAALDLDARIASQQASVSRVRALLARATTIGEIVSVEGELTRREAELASLVQRKRNLTERVDYSTITLSLRGPTAQVTEPADESGFLAGLKDGWNAFVSTIGAILTVLGAILPFLIVIVPLVVLFWWLRRRAAARTAAYDSRVGAVPAAYGLTPAPATPGPAPTDAAKSD